MREGQIQSIVGIKCRSIWSTF